VKVSYLNYSPKSIIRAKKVYGIYRGLIGYDFPKEWGEVKITTADRMKYWKSRL
jgi:hypothetical protein